MSDKTPRFEAWDARRHHRTGNRNAWRRQAVAAHGIAAALLLASLIAGTSAHERSGAKHTFNQHVRPILRDQCAGCHRPGGPAPMSLLSFEEAQPWASAIKLEVLERRMPPWPPEEGFGRFQGASYLTAKEIEAIADWATGGTPEGDPLPDSARNHNEVSEVPQPDLILEPARAISIPAGTDEGDFCLELRNPAADDRWVGAWELLPGNPGTIRRATLFLNERCSADGEAPFPWVAGRSPSQVPPGTGISLRAHAALSARIQYKKTWSYEGRELKDRSRVGIYLTEATRPLVTYAAAGPRFRLPKDIRLAALEAESSVRVEARTPGGRIIPLLRIDRWDPLWQTAFLFEQPLALEAGTILSIGDGRLRLHGF